MRKSRLLLIADSLGGGLGNLVVRQASMFGKWDWDVKLISKPGSTLAEAGGADGGFQVEEIRIPRTVRALREMRQGSLELRRIRDSFRPDIVHAHEVRSFLLCLLSGGADFMTVHGTGSVPSDPPLFSTLRRAGLWLIPNLVPRAFSSSPELNRFEFAPYASPLLTQLSAAPPREMHEIPTFLWLGRLAEQKRPDLFVEAIALASRKTQLQGWMAGTGPLESAVRSQIAALNAPVKLLGQVQNVSDVIGKSWAVALFSWFEGMPLAIQEAMWCARSAVVSDLEPLRWLIGDAGWVVGDAQAAASAFLRLTDKYVAVENGRRAAAQVRERIVLDAPLPQLRDAYEAEIRRKVLRRP